MSFFNYILVPILFVIHLAAAYAIPIIATLRSRNNAQRWIIHWIVFLLLRITVFKSLRLAVRWRSILATAGIQRASSAICPSSACNILLKQTEAVKTKLLEVVKTATAYANKYYGIAKTQIEKAQL